MERKNVSKNVNSKKFSEKLKKRIESLLNNNGGLFAEIQKDIHFRIKELERLSSDLDKMEKQNLENSPVDYYETASEILDAMEQNGIGNGYQRNLFAGFICDMDDLTVDFDKLPIINK